MKTKPLILLFTVASLLSGCSEEKQPATQEMPPVHKQPVEVQPEVTPAPKMEPPLAQDSNDYSPKTIKQEVKELADIILNESDIDMPKKELEQEIMKMVDEMESQKTR